MLGGPAHRHQFTVNLAPSLIAASIVVSGLALAGIAIGTPLVQGNVVTFEAGHEATRKELSRTELQALSEWLRLHKSNWHGMLTEAPVGQKSRLDISLKDATGKTGSMAVVARAQGGYYLRFISSSEKWSYQSFGGLFKSWAATRQLSAEDLKQLLRAVGISETPE
jgi:hypothetical protein